MNNEMKCSYCDGHGEVAPHILDDQPCPVCKGTGKKLADHAAEIERLSNTIEIQRKIRAYVAFVLAGDELADVQMAADKTMEKLEAAESKLSQLQLSVREYLAHDGRLGSKDYDAPKLYDARKQILAILNGGQQ